MSSYKESLEYIIEKDGFSYGEITQHISEDRLDPCVKGDAVIKTPDGTYIDVAWNLSDEPYAEMPYEAKVSKTCFMYLGFIRPIRTIEDLEINFHSVLPFIKDRFPFK